ncbi:MAG TPA: hypothetical protein VM677_04895 [Actinokineospora sp.]|jgi:hypothetical protein|nr:hypothetical protein [Actinokineospora sp.]
MSLYRKGISLAAAFAIGGVALAGCTSAPIGSPAPATASASQSTMDRAAVVTSAPSAPSVPSTTAAPPGAAAAPTLGPPGYGALKLGMSQAAALATKLLKPVEPVGGHCELYDNKRFEDSRVWISSKLGLVSVDAPSGVLTPQGVGKGASMAAVERAYPDLLATPNGHMAKVPGNPKAMYVFFFTRANKVEAITLELRGQDCYR